MSGDLARKIVKPKAAGTERPSLAREIDENLKRAYAAQLREDVPDRFRALFAQLREKEGK